MATSKKKTKVPQSKASAKPTARVVKAGSKARPSKAGSQARKPMLWLVPVGMLLVLAAVATFVVVHARYLASLKFDMVRTAHIVPQGHDQGQGTGLANLAGDAQGHMFMLESQPDFPVRLQRFDAQDSPDTLIYKSSRPGQDITGAVDVDCDTKGNVYVLLVDGRVQILDNNLNYLRTVQTGVLHGTAVSVNSAGRIYVADQNDNKVVYFGADGRRAGDFGSPGTNSTPLVSPTLMRVTPNDEVVVVENTPNGLRGRIFTKDLSLRKTFLIDKIQNSPPVRMGINSQDKAFFNDPAGSLGIVCWDITTGKYFGASQATKDGVQFQSPGCLGADRYTPDVYVHTVPGLVKCVLPTPGDGGEK